MENEDCDNKSFEELASGIRSDLRSDLLYSGLSCIYHYTSPIGLKGILENKFLYFTDCQFLNDMQERISINETFNNYIELEKLHGNINEVFYNLLSKVNPNGYIGKEFAYSENGLNLCECRYYVFSCSLNGDNLSLWKYYSKGNGYEGYNIRLDNIFIDLILENTTEYRNAISGKVVYDVGEKNKILNKLVKPLYEYWKNNKRTPEIDEKIVHEIEDNLKMLSLFFKSCHFYAEEEYRYVIPLPDDNDKIYFRESNGIFIPQIKVKFDERINEYNPIEAIVIGPTSKTETKFGLSKMSNKYGFDKISVSYSTIPVRY